MKRFFKAVTVILTVLALILSVGCDDTVEYTMGECKTFGMEYLVPLHFALSEHEEADDYYITVNSTVAAYAYTYDEFEDIFEYDGEFESIAIAEHVTTLRNYACNVYEGTVAGSAGFSFMFTNEDGQSFYYTASVHVSEERVYMLAFTCLAEKLDRYQDMIIEIMNSVTIDESDDSAEE